MLLLTDEVKPVSLEIIAPNLAPVRRRLISAGEKMLGELSFRGASLHKIAYAAGLVKKNAVQYHFGGIEGLADVIFSVRQTYIAQRRQELLDRARERELLNDVRALLEALYLPMAEQIDETGQHSYVRFFLQYFIRPGYDARKDDRMTPREGPSQEIYQQLSSLLKVEYDEVAHHIYLMSFIMYAALLERDGRTSDDRQTIGDTVSRTVLVMAASTLTPGAQV